MMRVLIWPTDPTTGIGIVGALRALDFNASASDATLGGLRKDAAAIGVYMALSPLAATHFLRSARETGVVNCIMVLLATIGEPGELAQQRVSVLCAGADDVQHWPIDMRELVARLHAAARRARPISDAPVSLPGGFYYRETGKIVGEDCTIQLTKQEHAVFEALVGRGDNLVTKDQIMTALYHGMDEPHEKIVDVFVCKLRKKLAPVSDELEVIQTVWGQGYRFVPHGFRPARVYVLKRIAARP